MQLLKQLLKNPKAAKPETKEKTPADKKNERIGTGVMVGAVVILALILLLTGSRKGSSDASSSTSSDVTEAVGMTEDTTGDAGVPAEEDVPSGDTSPEGTPLEDVPLNDTPPDNDSAISAPDDEMLPADDGTPSETTSLGINPDAVLLVPGSDIEQIPENYTGDRGYDDDILLETESSWTDKNSFYVSVREETVGIASEYMVNPAVIVTLAMENSAWGQLETAVKYNNPFRIRSDGMGIHLALVYQDMMGMTVTEEAVYKTYMSIGDSIRDMASILVSLNITEDTPLFDSFRTLSEGTALVYPYYVDHLVSQAERIEKQLNTTEDNIPHYTWGT